MAVPLNSRDEAAKILRTSTRTLDKWHEQGIGPRVTWLGKRRWYTDEALEEFVRHSQEPAQAETA